MRNCNFGCGIDIRKGWENYDKFPAEDSVTEMDLNVLPLHFDDNSIDRIVMNSIFEHLTIDRYLLMCEIYRILKPRGIVEINVPVSNRCMNHTLWFFPLKYFNNICVNESKHTDSNPYYKNINFKMIKKVRVGNSLNKRIVDLFPVLEKLFPYMCHYRVYWKMEKI